MQQQILKLTVTYRCAPNIAWVKYWGKYNEQYILPINDSLGLTLNSDDISTETTITFTRDLQEHELVLNNETHEISGRMHKMFMRVKNLIYVRKYQSKISVEQWLKYYFKVESINRFPTASGMASSASGMACLAGSLNGLFGNVLTEVQLCELARLGSGSAARSIHGGLVLWRGVPEQQLSTEASVSEQTLEYLSKHCISHTVIPEQNLQFMKVLIIMDKDRKKEMSSTQGMQNSVQTSQLIAYRNKLASKHLQTIVHTLQELNQHNEIDSFNTIAQMIIKDSNQFHAICLDTYPPIIYLSELSRQVMYMVDHCINPFIDYKVGYTFDAGPHAFLFVHNAVYLRILKYFVGMLGVEKSQLNSRACEELSETEGVSISQFKEYKWQGIERANQVWLTDVGSGCVMLK